MAAQKTIWIACPQYMKQVRGTYECDASGRYRLGADGKFLLEFARCSQDDGRCMQTLCALHRYNRRGPGSWYPELLITMRQPRGGHEP